MKQLNIRSIGAVGALIISLAVAGCGGGGGGYSAPPSTTPPPPPPSQAGGITGTGSILGPTSTSASVVVNGVTLNASTAVVKIDDRTGTLAEVKDGMTGKVRGRVNDDRVTGTAETIEIENEVRGVARAVNALAVPPSFQVNNQLVYVDSQTLYGNLAPASFAGLVDGVTYVEVHGLRDSKGAIRATRIEGQTQGAAGLLDEIRGTVGALGAAGSNTFTMTTLAVSTPVTVNYAGATFVGGTAANLAAGVVVEVHGTFNSGTNTFAATRVDLEDVEDDSLLPKSTDVDAEAEGYVSGFTALTAEFKVGARRVILSTTTTVRFEGGSSADLANDVRVEAEGNVNSSGVLVANKIQFKSARIVLQGKPSVVGTNTLVLLGKTVQVNTLTKIDTRDAGGQNSTSLSAIVPNSDCVQVRAGLDGADIVADEVKELSSGGCKDIVQARVTAKNDAARTLTMLGIDVNLSGAAVVFRDPSDAVIGAAAFFGAINTTTGTVVKAKGSFSGANLLTGEEAELEN